MKTKKLISPDDIKKVASRENISVSSLTASLRRGEAILVTSRRRGVDPVGIGKNLRAKFACIVGTSSSERDMVAVIRKAKIAVESGASVVHNGSSGGDVQEMQKKLLDAVTVPLAVCHPIGLMADACYRKRRFLDLSEGEFIKQFRRDVEQGIEVILLPLGITRSLLNLVKKSRRIMPCCSKSGSIMSAWMAHSGRENPYHVHFDEILHIAKEHNTTLSIVGAFRSGCIQDALDEVQYAELKNIKEYVDRSREAGVNIKAGSGGHIPADKIASFITYQKKLLKTPLICFGPQVTDISLGYDHVSAAMGQVIALLSGADIIFSMTPAEHLSMPDEEQTRHGCITAKIVCHSANIAKGKDVDRDIVLSRAREATDWNKQIKFALDQPVMEKLKAASMNKTTCTVCGDFCAYKLINIVHKRSKRTSASNDN